MKIALNDGKCRLDKGGEGYSVRVKVARVNTRSKELRTSCSVMSDSYQVEKYRFLRSKQMYTRIKEFYLEP